MSKQKLDGTYFADLQRAYFADLQRALERVLDKGISIRVRYAETNCGYYYTKENGGIPSLIKIAKYSGAGGFTYITPMPEGWELIDGWPVRVAPGWEAKERLERIARVRTEFSKPKGARTRFPSQTIMRSVSAVANAEPAKPKRIWYGGNEE